MNNLKATDEAHEQSKDVSGAAKAADTVKKLDTVVDDIPLNHVDDVLDEIEKFYDDIYEQQRYVDVEYDEFLDDLQNVDIDVPKVESGADAIQIGKTDLDALRNKLGVLETDTIAVGKTDVKGLEGVTFEGQSPKVRSEAGLPDLDEIWAGRNIELPGNNPLFTRHAEEVLANDFKLWSIKTIKYEIS